MSLKEVGTKIKYLKQKEKSALRAEHFLTQFIFAMSC
jgi:hypothetical protein